MSGPSTLQYHVVFTRDPETASVVAEVPALQIADFGVDVPEALERLQSMATFHLECLRQEGKLIPTEGASFSDRGSVLLRIRLTARILP